MNIAVRSPNWIGDCIMSLPALRALRTFFPQSNIFLVTRKNLQDIYKNISEINQIITIPEKKDFNFFEAVKKIRKFSFDFGVLFTNSFHSALLFRLSGIRKLIGYKKDLRGFLLTKKKSFPQNDKHHTAFYFDLVKMLSQIQTDKIEIADEQTFSDHLVITRDEINQVRSFLQKKGIHKNQTLIGMSPAAAYGSAKEWLPDRFGEIMGKLSKTRSDLQFLVFGSRSEKNRISKLVDNQATKVINLAGELSLRQSIIAISFCSLFISNDSGLMHIASSVMVPTVAIFGPTLPHKTAPLKQSIRVLYHRVDCAPCKHRECPLDHRCMKEIKVDDVLQQAISVLEDQHG